MGTTSFPRPAQERLGRVGSMLRRRPVPCKRARPGRPRVDAARARREIALFAKGARMNEETFNLSIRKFLKMVGVNSQREIEQAVDRARANASIKGDEKF